MKRFRVGTRVRIRVGRSHHPGRRGVAKIEQFYSDIRGGVRLNKMLAGFYSWNTADLEIVKR